MYIIFFIHIQPKANSMSAHGGGMKLAKKQTTNNPFSDWGVTNVQEEVDFECTEDSGLQQASAYNWDSPGQDGDFFSSAMGLPKVQLFNCHVFQFWGRLYYQLCHDVCMFVSKITQKIVDRF